MSERIDDDTIDAALLALAADLALPDVDDFTARVLTQLPEASVVAGRTARRNNRFGMARRRKWTVAVAVVLVATTATTLAIPDARATVAEWLGIDGVRIVRVDELPPGTSSAVTTTSAADEAGAPVTSTPQRADPEMLSALGLEPEPSLTEAAARLGFPVRRPTLVGLGPADLFGSGVAGRPTQLAQVWRSGAALGPSQALPHVAIVLTQLRVGLGSGGFQKVLPRGAVVEQVTVNGRPAWWITGDPHELSFFLTGGAIVTDSARLAGDTLLWTADDITYRLESSLGKGRAIALAESVR